MLLTCPLCKNTSPQNHLVITYGSIILCFLWEAILKEQNLSFAYRPELHRHDDQEDLRLRPLQGVHEKVDDAFVRQRRVQREGR